MKSFYRRLAGIAENSKLSQLKTFVARKFADCRHTTGPGKGNASKREQATTSTLAASSF
jgi:hypothetical protein